MTDILVPAILALPALVLALPVAADLGAFARARLRRLSKGRNSDRPGRSGSVVDPLPRLLFLMPAHDEEALVARSVGSLLGQDYPEDRRTVLVVADNCGDATASVALRAGARVEERRSRGRRGKHHAIGWALERIDLAEYDAVVLVDADTVVAEDFARRLAAWAPLGERLIQARVGASNEDENWLTRMSAVLTRCRWDLALPLKEEGRLNCPLTGDGTVLGTKILRDFPWEVETITEGWELYARFTLAKLRSHYEPKARLYAQEARSLGQSRSQRERWTAGRLSVLRRYLPEILKRDEIPLLQRIDLLAELSSTGPVFRSMLGLLGFAVAAWVGSTLGWVVAAIFLSPILLLAAYAALAIAREPHPLRTGAAFLRLPIYAGWRIWVGALAFVRSGTDRWVRTERHEEHVVRDPQRTGTGIAARER